MRIYQGQLSKSCHIQERKLIYISSLRPKEIALLSAPPPGEDDLAEFYTRFEGVKDFHRRHQGINARQFLHEIDELVRSDGLQTVQVDENGQEVVIDRM